MLRIVENVLTFDEDNKCYYNGILFTGFAYTVVNDIVEKIIEFKNGIEINLYKSTFFENQENLLKIDRDSLEGIEFESGEEGEPFLFRGNKFTGIAFDFDDEFCVSESLFEDGCICTEIGWYKSGKQEFYENFNDVLYDEMAYFYENGNRKQLILIKESGFRFDSQFSKDEKITLINIIKDYFGQISEAKSHFKYCLIDKKEDFKQYSAAERLNLSGEGIDDEIFNYIQINNGLIDTRFISIYNTSVGGNAIAQLANYHHLEKISIDDENNALINVTQELKNRLPDCEVIYNRKKIEVLK